MENNTYKERRPPYNPDVDTACPRSPACAGGSRPYYSSNSALPRIFWPSMYRPAASTALASPFNDTFTTARAQNYRCRIRGADRINKRPRPKADWYAAAKQTFFRSLGPPAAYLVVGFMGHFPIANIVAPYLYYKLAPFHYLESYNDEIKLVKGSPKWITFLRLRPKNGRNSRSLRYALALRVCFANSYIFRPFPSERSAGFRGVDTSQALWPSRIGRMRV